MYDADYWQQKRRTDKLILSGLMWAVVIGVIAFVMLAFRDRSDDVHDYLVERGYSNVHVYGRKWLSWCGKGSTGYGFSAKTASGQTVSNGTVCTNLFFYSVWE